MASSSLLPQPSSSAPVSSGKTEFEILKASHKFLRDEDEDGKSLSWDDKLAQKYYDSLYREFAVCDLKHYKSGEFALRWRTESEVLSGAGESSCGNTRCEHHNPDAENIPRLSTLELPFGYQEHGEFKEALVKVVLCDKCVKKMMWRRNKWKEFNDLGRKYAAAASAATSQKDGRGAEEAELNDRNERRKKREDRGKGEDGTRRERRRSSRSRSPRRRQDTGSRDGIERRRRSKS